MLKEFYEHQICFINSVSHVFSALTKLNQLIYSVFGVAKFPYILFYPIFRLLYLSKLVLFAVN